MAHDGPIDDGLGPWRADSGRMGRHVVPDAEVQNEFDRLHQAREVVSGENYRLRTAMREAATTLEKLAQVLRRAIDEDRRDDLREQAREGE